MTSGYSPWVNLNAHHWVLLNARRQSRKTGAIQLCRRHGFSEASFYLWRNKFGGMSVSDAKRLKELEGENTRLKRLLANAMLENEVIKEALQKKW